jgi:hypothetical protein
LQLFRCRPNPSALSARIAKYRDIFSALPAQLPAQQSARGQLTQRYENQSRKIVLANKAQQPQGS